MSVLISSQVKVGLRFVVKRNAVIKVTSSLNSDFLELKTCGVETQFFFNRGRY